MILTSIEAFCRERRGSASKVNPGDTVGPESWLSRYISDSLSENALKCSPITSLEAK